MSKFARRQNRPADDTEEDFYPNDTYDSEGPNLPVRKK